MDLKKEIKNNIGIIKICGDTSINTEKKLFEVLRGGKFCVCGVRLDEIDKLFNATKLNQLIPKFNDVDEAFIKFF